ncbi:MAG: ABC transporter ATP-binding protein, partial [Butyricicoccus porcorum]
LAVSHDRYFLDKIAGRIFEFRPDGHVREYLGNYADYLEKRGDAPEAVSKKTEAAPKPRKKPSEKLRMSYKDQYELEHIEDEIEAMEQQLAGLQAEQQANTSDFVALQQLAGQIEELSAKLEERTERWMELQELAERIEQQNS